MSFNVFVFSFDYNGFEAIIDLTDVNQQYVMAKLAGDDTAKSPDSILHMLQLRAQFNQGRGMEVWAARLDEELTEEDLWAMAQQDPQIVADWARGGTNIYGDHRQRPGRAIV